VYCGDPASKVQYKKPYSIYLPENLSFSGEGGAAEYVARVWFTMPGPWVCEGHVMARALRRWSNAKGISGYGFPCDRIIVLDCPAHRATTPGQEAMHKAVLTVWAQIGHRFATITETRTNKVSLGLTY
jgi:hypothetical protein